MGDNEAYLRTHVNTPRAAGEPGKGFVLNDGTVRTWRLLEFAGPHHADGMDILGLAAEEVAAYLQIAEDGRVQVLGGMSLSEEDEALIVRCIEATPDLYLEGPPSQQRWNFG